MTARTPILVGLVVITALVSLTWFVLGTSKDKFGASSTYPLYADFKDAAGIRGKTRLQINGLDVGKIEGIKHARGPDGRLVARVELRILNEYEVYENAVLRKAAESLLGDFRLDLDPGTPNYPKIPPGGIIKNVQTRSDIEEIQTQLKEVTQNVNQVTESFSKVLAGPEGEGSLKEILMSVNHSMAAIERTTEVLATMVTNNDKIINAMIGDLGQFSRALAAATAPGGDVKQLTENLARLSGRLDRIAASVDEVVGGTGPTERNQVQETLQNLNSSIATLNNVVRKIDEGQGTLGRVVNDQQLVESVEDTFESANRLLGSIANVKTEIELRTQYEVPFYNDNAQIQAAVKNILGLRIQPRPDKYYLLEAISDPRGTSTRKIISQTRDGGRTTSTEVNEISFNDLKFSAQFAKRYYFLTLRFGIIENTGGLGANLHAWDDRFELRLDAFDFARRDLNNESINPRFRSTAMIGFVEHLYLQAGLDDPFNRDLRTWFVGGVLRFNDDDLRSLLSIAPLP